MGSPTAPGEHRSSSLEAEVGTVPWSPPPHHTELWISLKSVPSTHLSKETGCTGSFSSFTSLQHLSPRVQLEPRLPMAWTQLLSNQTAHDGWDKASHVWERALAVQTDISSMGDTQMSEGSISQYRSPCALANRLTGLFSPQETLDSGGTICLHEGSRLPGPRHRPSLRDCPRGLLHWYWGADLKVF